jgi:hypothetical protein
MSKDLNQRQAEIMEHIRGGRLQMRPRAYFLLGSILGISGMIASVIGSTYLFGLISFSLRRHGPMGNYRLSQMIAEFPWWTIILAGVGLTAGIFLLKRREFSYRHNFKIVALIFILAVMAAGWLMDLTGLNDVFARRGLMRGLYRGQTTTNLNAPGPWWR